MVSKGNSSTTSYSLIIATLVLPVTPSLSQQRSILLCLSSPEALHVKRHERPLLVKYGIGREMTGQIGLQFRIPRKSQGSFTCRKSATLDRRLYFPSEGRHAVDFFARKIRRLQAGSNPRSWVKDPYDNNTTHKSQSDMHAIKRRSPGYQ
jgi:hypothetical protein